MSTSRGAPLCFSTENCARNLRELSEWKKTFSKRKRKIFLSERYTERGRKISFVRISFDLISETQ